VTLARGKKFTYEQQEYQVIISQYIKTSLWGEKALFVDFANYYFYRV
jgi:hypothetical protein